MLSQSLLAGVLTLAPLALAQNYASTTTFTFAGETLPTGLVKSNGIIGKAPYQHEYHPENAEVSDGFLNLIVNGGQENDEVIWSGEVSTRFTVASARVETHAILTDVAGVCNGMFFYEDENQEVDIEWLSDPNSQSNLDSPRERSIFYTNQPVNSGDETTETGAVPEDAFSAVHNYRIDWDGETSSAFYLDGELQQKHTKNVPTAKDGHWVWNNWSNGNKLWTAGPPKTDAVFKIQKIVMYYNPGV